MNDIVRKRMLFLFNCLITILLATVAAIIVNLFFIRRIAINPLYRLREAVCGFTSGENAYTEKNIVRLDFRSNDEISDLNQEICAMEERIVDYTHDLERVTAERERIRTELDLAAQIQHHALPVLGEDFSGRSEFVLGASMDPAKEAGGDFYDF
jgi:sigma-B regulation protein RsbU (phosphoserine phosphatase)